MERLLNRFRAAHTQPLGVSVDSVYCHANWAKSIGGVSFPLLADFHPKGQVAKSYGLYLEEAGITDRATVIIDAQGVVRHVSSVTPSGQRNIEELLALCEAIDKEHGGALAPLPEPPGFDKGGTLYIKSNCGYSRAVLLTLDNLHLHDRFTVKNVTDDPRAMEELKKATGKQQAPCLIMGEEPMLESEAIKTRLINAYSDIPC